MSAKSTASGFHGDKVSGSTDGGKGGSHVEKAGTGYIERLGASGHDGGKGDSNVPKDTGHSAGVAKAAKSSSAKRLKGDGVGGPLPSA